MLAFHQLIKFTCMNKLWGTKSIFFTFNISNFGRTLNINILRMLPMSVRYRIPARSVNLVNFHLVWFSSSTETKRISRFEDFRFLPQGQLWAPRKNFEPGWENIWTNIRLIRVVFILVKTSEFYSLTLEQLCSRRSWSIWNNYSDVSGWCPQIRCGGDPASST